MKTLILLSVLLLILVGVFAYEGWPDVWMLQIGAIACALCAGILKGLGDNGW